MQRIYQINADPPQVPRLDQSEFPVFIQYLQNTFYRKSDEEFFQKQNQDVLHQLKYNRELLKQLTKPQIIEQNNENQIESHIFIEQSKVIEEQIRVCQILQSQLLKTQTIYKLLFDQSLVQQHMYCGGSMDSLNQENENEIVDLCKKLELSLGHSMIYLQQLEEQVQKNILYKEQQCVNLQDFINVKLKSKVLQQSVDQGCYHRYLENYKRTQLNQQIDQIYQCECHSDPSLQTFQAIIFNMLSEKYPRQFLADDRLKPLLGQYNNLSLYLSDIIEIDQFNEKMLNQPALQKPSESLRYEAMIVGNYKLVLNYIGEGSLRYQQELMDDDDDGQLYNPQEYFYALRELMLNLKYSYKKKQDQLIKICICNVFITKVNHSCNIFGIRLKIGNKVCRQHRGVAFFLHEYFRVFLKQDNRSFGTDSDYETLKSFIKDQFKFDNTYKRYYEITLTASAKNKIRFIMYALYNVQKVIEYLKNRQNISDYFIIKEYEIKQILRDSQYFTNTNFLNINQSTVNLYQQSRLRIQEMKAQVIQYLNNHPNNLIKLRMLFFVNECLLLYPKVNDTFSLYSKWNEAKYSVLPKYLELYLQNPLFSPLIEQMINQINV